MKLFNFGDLVAMIMLGLVCWLMVQFYEANASTDYNQLSKDLLCMGQHIDCEANTWQK